MLEARYLKSGEKSATTKTYQMLLKGFHMIPSWLGHYLIRFSQITDLVLEQKALAGELEVSRVKSAE